MENIYKQIDGIFKNGLINSGISIILSIIAILIINKIINKVLKKQIKDPLKLTLPSLGLSNPPAKTIVVVFPLPLAPTIA